MQFPKAVLSTVPGQEFWRRRYNYHLQEKSRLYSYVTGRRRQRQTFQGSGRYYVEIVGRNVYAQKGNHSYSWLEPPRPLGRVVGRFFGEYLVLHKKRAPRWLRNWAKHMDKVVVLPKLDRGTLAAHLMQERLLEAP